MEAPCGSWTSGLTRLVSPRSFRARAGRGPRINPSGTPFFKVALPAIKRGKTKVVTVTLEALPDRASTRVLQLEAAEALNGVALAGIGADNFQVSIKS